ncbi:MAG: VanZ family protein [Planctomyces sp.]|nr:VanZ family protein [Planctomyces sp.]
MPVDIRSPLPQTGRPRTHAALYLLLAVLCASFSIYGSLLPFRFRETTLQDAWTAFLHSPLTPTWSRGRIDGLANAMLFMPVGFGLAGWLNAGWTRPIRTVFIVLLTLSLTAMISTMNEVAQAWIAARTSSRSDVVCQLAGSSAGVLGWLVIGATLDRWITGFRTAHRSPDRLRACLALYFAGFVVVQLIPFDVTIHPVDLWHKFQNGRISLVPFQNVSPTADGLFGLLQLFLLTLPLGLLGVLRFPGSSSPPRTVLGGAAAALFLVGCVEAGQVLIESRYAEATDLIVGGLAGLAGAALAGWLIVGRQPSPGIAESPGRTVPWEALTAAYLLIPACVLWWPLKFSAEPDMLRSKFRSAARLPLDGLLLNQSYARSISQFVERSVLYLPLGVLVGLSLANRRLGANRRWSVALGTLVIVSLAAGIEFGQFFVPTRIPDLADVLIASFGGFLGLLAVHMTTAGDDESPSERSRTEILASGPRASHNEPVLRFQGHRRQ